MNRGLFLWNGVDGASGGYLRRPRTPAEVARRALRTPPAGPDPRAPGAGARPLKGLPEGIDPKELAATGWGVVFPAKGDPKVREALAELLEWRRSQVGDEGRGRYREFAGHHGYRRGETSLDFLERFGAAPGPARPDRVPYYLLLASGPEEIPFDFQVQLDVQYAVGRLDFDRPEDYAEYARRVVAAERERARHPGAERRVAFFAPEIPGDPTTTQLLGELAAPLSEALAERHPGWCVEARLGDRATKEKLRPWLAEGSPELLFVACHGVGFASGAPRQRSVQGALVCRDWPGPGTPPAADHLFAAADVDGDGSTARPPLLFLFACHSAGTPREDAFDQDAEGRPLLVAPRPFTASLPQRLLAGGTLAVIGHLERAWTWSFHWRGAGRQLAVFESALTRLLEGQPVGWAMEYFNQRYAELATLLDEEVHRPVAGNDRRVAQLWTARNDARNYVVLGDPAVRLPEARP